MTAYIFFRITYDEFEKYNDAEIYHSANNHTTPILFTNYDYYIDEEVKDNWIRWVIYKVDTTDNIINNILFKIKLDNEYILLTDCIYFTKYDNGNINNIIKVTKNSFDNGILKIFTNIHNDIIKIYRGGSTYVGGGIYLNLPAFKLYEGPWEDIKYNGLDT